MSGTRENGWLQKFMYVLIAVLGIYILYKGIFLLMKSESLRQSVESSALPRNAEDAAVRTYTPGYAAAVEGKDGGGWLAGLMEPLVPVYSYLTEMRADISETGSSADQQTDIQSGREVKGQANDQEKNQDDIPGSGQVSEKADDGGNGTKTTEGQITDNSGIQEEAAEAAEGESDFTGKTAGSVEGESGLAGQAAGAVESESVFTGDTADTVDKAGSAGGQVPEETDAVLEAAGIGAGTGFGDVMLEQLRDFNYLLSNYYTVDGGTTIDSTMLDADRLLTEDLSIVKNPEVPQILIYHTHSQEYFADSVEGDESTSVVGAGEVLAELLRTKYGYQVIHDTGVYDLVDGVLDRSAAYDYARNAVQQILEDNPTIEVVIDLHRDGVDGQKFVTEIDGKPASMIMFFNGLSRDETGAPLTWLDNPYVEDNLAFSLQLQLMARQQYPGYTRNIYLKAERFNLHLRPRSLLIEAGTQLNTVEEEKNAMEPLAGLLAQVLGGVQ